MGAAAARSAGRHRLHRPQDDDVTRRRAGEAQPKGRLDRVQGRFRLANGVDAPGAIGLAGAFALIVADWQRQAQIQQVTPQAVTFYIEKNTALVAYATAKGCQTLADLTQPVIYTWMRTRKTDDPAASISNNTLYSRRSAARALFTTAMCLGLHDQDPTRAIEISKRSPKFVHPVTAGEVGQLKLCAAYRIGETKVPATLALSLCCAASGESPYVTVRDVDLTNRLVWLDSTSPITRSRWVPIDDDWCLTALAARIAALTRDTDPDLLAERPLVYDLTSGEDTANKRSSATATALTKLMQTARVYRKGVTRAESIREYVAVQTYAATGSVEAVAARLGMSSLDAAAHIVGHDWVPAHSPAMPPPAWAKANVEDAEPGASTS